MEQITIKPGLCTKPEFCTNGSKRHLTGGQNYKNGRQKVVLYSYFGPNGQLHSPRNFSMNVTSVLMNRNFEEWVYDHIYLCNLFWCPQVRETTCTPQLEIKLRPSKMCFILLLLTLAIKINTLIHIIRQKTAINAPFRINSCACNKTLKDF